MLLYSANISIYSFLSPLKKKSSGSKKRMSVVEEGEDEEVGITIKASSKINQGFTIGETIYE